MLTLKGKTKKLKWNFQRDWGVETNKPLRGRVRIFLKQNNAKKEGKKNLVDFTLMAKNRYTVFLLTMNSLCPRKMELSL